MAVFNRQPDAGAHTCWVRRADTELTLSETARCLINSPEFIDTYNTLNNAEFVDLPAPVGQTPLDNTRPESLPSAPSERNRTAHPLRHRITHGQPQSDADG